MVYATLLILKHHPEKMVGVWLQNSKVLLRYPSLKIGLFYVQYSTLYIHGTLPGIHMNVPKFYKYQTLVTFKLHTNPFTNI